MKTRVGIVVALALALGGLSGLAGAKNEKVDICHVNGSTGAAPFPPADPVVAITYGRIISVAENALSSHEAHGDGPVQFTPGNNPNVWVYGDAFGVSGNSDCAFNVFLF